MKKISILFLTIFLLANMTHAAYAIEDPLKTSNNMFGVHILFPAELTAAATLVNSHGGDWGYVTIPIQSGDKNILKWQNFMNTCKNLHIIPMLRLATQGDYFNTSVWSRPTYADILDFANFLDSLSWPTKNQYIIVYNEPNRGDEWNGKSDPEEYANILSYSVTAFKTKNPDFFIISAGLDDAAATSSTSYDAYTFLRHMNQAVPGIFSQIDGEGVHAYPNPAFSQPPTLISTEGISSFRYENSFISSVTSKQLPIFITETGWSRETLSDTTIANYFKIAFSNVWNDKRIVSVTPFLLEAGAGPFETFSLLKTDGNDTPVSQALKSIIKIKGAPTLNTDVLSAETLLNIHAPIKKFPEIKNEKIDDSQFLASIKQVAKYLLHI